MKVVRFLCLLINQRGNIVNAIGFALILLFVVMVLLPTKTSPLPKPTTDCTVGIVPKEQVIVKLPEIDTMPPGYFLEDGETYQGKGPKPDQMVDYQLIRERVPIINWDKWYHPNLSWTLFEGGSTGNHHVKTNLSVPGKEGFTIYYPVVAASIDTKYGILSTHKERLILFRYNDPNTVSGEGVNSIYLVDVYQQKSVLEGPNHFYTTDDLMPCIKGRTYEADKGSIYIPDQNPSKDQEQLQLQYFLLQKSGGGIWSIHCKPAIYLYPPKKQLVNVKVHPAGFLAYVDPEYDKDVGWNVLANPNGRLEMMNNKDKIYDYLYFESKIHDEVIQKPEKGWVIKFNQLESKFEEILPKLGLNEAQTHDFIHYWQKALPASPYYFVGIINQQNVDQIERLEITPKPDSVNRVRIYFERLDEPKKVEAPDLSQFGTWDMSLGASTFKVVEWGGMVKNDPNHPFTCSQ